MGEETGPRAVVRDAQAGQWLLFSRPVRVLSSTSPSDVAGILADLDRSCAPGGLWAVGFVGYEAAPGLDPALPVRPVDDGRPCIWFGLFGDPVRCDELEDPGLAPALDWRPETTEAHYCDCIQCIHAYLEEGQTYQVNHTYRSRSPFTGDPWSLFPALARAQMAPHAVYIDGGEWAICSASPELFLERRGSRLVSRPMKGTARRGLGYHDDRQAAAELQASEKNRAENLMIVDMVRNDMGRVARTGTVHTTALFAAEQYPTVWQLTSTVECETDAGLPAVFGALFPAASITGAPKRRTMAIISELERSPRGVYCGAAGAIEPGGDFSFNVAIRTVWVDRLRGMAEYGVGGGIVADSQARSEWEECMAKSLVLHHHEPGFDLLETLVWVPGMGYAHLAGHMRRLRQSAAYFGWTLDGDRILHALKAAVPGELQGRLRVRLTVGRRGEVAVTSDTLQPLATPYRLRPASSAVDPEDRFLYHKTTHRTAYQAAMEGLEGCEDALLWTPGGLATETTIANLFVTVGDRLVTPRAASGLLSGVLREAMLAEGKAEEGDIPLSSLVPGTRVMLGNSVRGLWSAVIV